MANQVSHLVERVFVLMLENRSLDHMLGFSGIKGTDAETGKPTAIAGLTGKESNTYNGLTFAVRQPADWTMPLDPGHEFTDVLVQLCGPDAVYHPHGAYPAINATGYAGSYVKHGGASNPGEIMKCFGPAQLPVLTALASEFALCDGWRSSMPGPTWPNRFFMMAASSGGLDHSPSVLQIAEWMTVDGFDFEHGTLFAALSRAHKTWRIYHGNQGPLNGVRVPAVIASPHIPQNLIDHRTYDHASIPATVERIFGFPTLTQRDAHARDVTSLVTLPEPRPTPEHLPELTPAPAATPKLVQIAGKAGEDGPVDNGTLPGFLHIAQRNDLLLSPPEQHPAINARVASISTRGEARQYLEEVAVKTGAAREARGL